MIHLDKELSYIEGNKWEGIEVIIINKIVRCREA